MTADEVLGFVGHCAVSLFGTNKPRGPKWYREDPQILVWALTSTEVLSALYRRFREGRLTSRELSDCCQQVHTLREDWSEVGDVELVKQRAERLLQVHPLRAADVLQLGAALLAQEHNRGQTRII